MASNFLKPNYFTGGYAQVKPVTPQTFKPASTPTTPNYLSPNYFTGGYNSYTPTTPQNFIPTSIKAGGGSSSGGSSVLGASASNIQDPTTITARSLGSPSGSISLASPAPLSNPGSSMVSAGNAGLINGMTDYGFTQDANGLWVMNPTDTTDKTSDVTAAKTRWDNLKETLGLTPQKENVIQSPEIRAQNALVEQRQAEVNNATSQLNTIVAKQQQDLLSTRGTLSKEGGTEAVYGGIEATINREAAIKALPIQAALAGAQGNLQLAQQHLKTLVDMKTEEATNEYNYKVLQYNAIKDFVTGEQKIQLEQMEKANDRAYTEKQDLIKVQATLMANAVQQGAPSSVVQSISSATSQFGAINAAGKWGGDMTKNSGSSGGEATSFIDVLQKAIDEGATPNEAARAAALVAENQGIQIDLKTLNSFTDTAKTLTKTPASTTEAPVAATSTPLTAKKLGQGLRESGFNEYLPLAFVDTNRAITIKTVEGIGNFFSGLFGK